MHWSQLESSQPRLADLGRRRLIGPGVVLVATILLRDPRVLVHSVIASRDGAEGEFKIRGVARVEDEPEIQHRYAHTAAEHLGWTPEPGRFHLFAVDIDEVTFIRYEPNSGDQYTTTWPPGREFVRRATSATSVGQPEATSDILITD